MLETKRIKDAHQFATNKHHDQKRKFTGEAYVMHPLRVYLILRACGLTEDVQIAGLLHDTIEDTDATIEEITSLFGERIASMVYSLTKKSDQKYFDYNIGLFDAGSNVASIKAADIFDNCSTVAIHDKEYARKYIENKDKQLSFLRRADPAILKMTQVLLSNIYMSLNNDTSFSILYLREFKL